MCRFVLLELRAAGGGAVQRCSSRGRWLTEDEAAELQLAGFAGAQLSEPR